MYVCVLCCYRLESLDSKIKVYQTRRDAARTSDRDSPFTPMAAEIPTVSRGGSSRGLLPTQQEDNLLLNTPLSSPPESLVDETIVPGTSLNRGTYIYTVYSVCW